MWNLIRGGTEGQCARVAMALAAQGFPMKVAVFRREGFFLDAVAAACGDPYHVDIRRFASLETWRQIRRLATFIRAQGVDLVHTWDADASIFASLAASQAGVPLITSRRDLGEIYPWYKLQLMRRADRRARAVVVNAEAIAERVRRQGVPASRIVCLPNLIDLAEFDRLAQAGLPPDVSLPPGPRVGMVARLDPEKDGTTFVRAAVQVAAAVPRVSFVIAGEGPDRPALQALVAAAGLQQRIVFLGEVMYVPALVAQLDLGVLVPRANEGLSNTLLEYRAGRLPVVATDCGGNRELVAHGQDGFLVEPGNAAALADRIVDLLKDPARGTAMGRLGRQQVETTCRPAAVAGQFRALYERITGTR